LSFRYLPRNWLGDRSIFHFFIWILPADRSAKYFHGTNVIAERRALMESVKLAPHSTNLHIERDRAFVPFSDLKLHRVAFV
jgi:hypothetical protein